MQHPTRQKRVKIVLTLLVAAAWCVAAVAPASARIAQTPTETPTTAPSPAQFAVQPSGPNGPGNRDWFVYTLAPGAVFGDTVAISNLSDRAVRFGIYPADVRGVSDVGGLAPIRDDETSTDVGTWITLKAAEQVVAPGTRIDMPFSITVPDDAAPGDHVGAIIAVDADAGSFDPANASSGVNVGVRERVGARVYVRVSGPASPALRVERLDVARHGSGATVSWEVRNTGNLRLTPTARVEITGFLGRHVAWASEQQIPELLPNGNYVSGTEFKGLPSHERLTAHLVVQAEGIKVERTKKFGSYPWIVLAILIALIATGIWYLRRRRRSQPTPSVVTPPSRERKRVPTPV